MSGGSIRLVISRPGSDQTEEKRFDATGGPVVIGRDPECQVPLAAQSISRKHATIEPAPDGWIVVDHSTLGTRLNDRAMESGETALLSDGDTLDLHGNIIRVVLPHPTSGNNIEDPGGDLMRFVEKEGAGEEGRIEVIHAGTNAGNVSLGEEGSSLLIGRSRECDVVVDDPLRLVSGVHARVEREWAGAFVYDLSRNGVYVNGAKVEDCASISDGDRITLALAEEHPDGVVLIFRDSPPGSEPFRAEEGIPETPETDAVEPSTETVQPAETDNSEDQGEDRRMPDDDRTEQASHRSGGGNAFFWIVIAVAAVVIAAFALIGIRIYMG